MERSQDNGNDDDDFYGRDYDRHLSEEIEDDDFDYEEKGWFDGRPFDSFADETDYDE